jgi:hypothetical protein
VKKPDFQWDVELEHRLGAPRNLLRIDVFVEFNWAKTVGHTQTQFPYGQCLARRVRKECPADRRPCLLLTKRDDVKEGLFQSDTFYVVVVNLPRYLKSANTDASAAYFGDSIGTGLTRMSRIEEIVGSSPEEIDAFLDLKLTPDRVSEWASGNAQRIAALRRIVGDDESPASAAKAIEILEGIEGLSAEEAGRIGDLLSDPKGRQLVELLTEHDLLPADLMRSVDHHRRCKAVAQLEQMLSKDLTEAPWQQWFEGNDWVLGTEYVQLLEERSIDVDHIADYLMEAYDGFLDPVEIKRPEGRLRFWAESLDHGNLVPHTDLIKAITQASRYILEVERESGNLKFFERIGGVKAIKPRCVLIYGRSADWGEKEREAYRLLNASYYNLTILTFDHVLERARRILDLQKSSP